MHSLASLQTLRAAAAWRRYPRRLLKTHGLGPVLGLSVTESTWAKQESFFVAYLVLTGLVSHLPYRAIESGQMARRLYWSLKDDQRHEN